jgi:hypothetical protein
MSQSSLLCVSPAQAEAALFRRILGPLNDAELEAGLDEHIVHKDYEVRVVFDRDTRDSDEKLLGARLLAEPL